MPAHAETVKEGAQVQMAVVGAGVSAGVGAGIGSAVGAGTGTAVGANVTVS